MYIKRLTLRKYIFILMGVVAFASLFACGKKYNNHYARVLREQREIVKEKSESEKEDTQLIKTNQILAKKEQEKIKGYIDRRGWSMTKLNNGIYIDVLSEGKGSRILKDSKVTITYSVELLSGESVISASKPKTETLSMDKQMAVIGLYYVLREKSQGAKIRAIIPSFMAYGMAGDGDKIPRRATLVYLLEVKNVK